MCISPGGPTIVLIICSLANFQACNITLLYIILLFSPFYYLLLLD